MPTFNQLVKNGRAKSEYKSKVQVCVLERALQLEIG